MTINMESYSEKIDDYLNGMLSPRQRSKFLTDNAGNNSLLKDIKFQEDIRDTMQDEGFIKLRNVLNKRKSEIKSAPFYISVYRKTSKRTIFAMAASLALFIVSGLLYLFLNGQILAPEQIAQKYYSPANAIQNLRSVEQKDLMGTKKAFTYYNNGQYAVALEIFLTIENKVVSNFYAGICYFELNDFKKAEQSFDFVIHDEYNMFIEQAQWYLMLSYLKISDIKKAKELLKQISHSESPYASKSNEILKELD